MKLSTETEIEFISYREDEHRRFFNVEITQPKIENYDGNRQAQILDEEITKGMNIYRNLQEKSIKKYLQDILNFLDFYPNELPNKMKQLKELINEIGC